MRQQWADYRLFLQEFRRTFQTTGAVLPSGRGLAAALARPIREIGDEYRGKERRILEIGPGTGSVTARIIRDLRPEDRFVMVERNEQFVARLRERLLCEPAFQRPIPGQITLVHAGVEELPEDVQDRYDIVISGLPLNNFSVEFVEQLLEKLRRLLLPGGTLSFFEYIAIRRVKSAVSSNAEQKRLRGIGAALDRMFRSALVRHDCVLANVPPAWVHHLSWSREAPSGD